MISAKHHAVSTRIHAGNDPWDPLSSLQRYGRHRLTSIELTVSNLCNMRCEHCAVGESLTFQEEPHLPLSTILAKLDEVEQLETLSITGGEPTYQEKTVQEYIVPLLKYAQERNVRTQLNSNLTLDYARYEMIAPYLDVMHISFNYLDEDDYHQIGFARANRDVSRSTAVHLYERMIDNTRRLSKGGLFVSAESMINTRTHRQLGEIHRLIAEMGCLRHEVHPMYPSSFARNLPLLTLDEIREAIGQLLDQRLPEVWVLFGTLPFYQCSEHEEDRRLLERIRRETNVTVRNDPDGRNRLNINMFTGDVFVTDFSEVPPLGNIHLDRLNDVFERWMGHPLYGDINCYCPAAACCGPNPLVVNTYYPKVDFTARKAIW